MYNKILLLILFTSANIIHVFSQLNLLSNTWIADLGNGNYKNPILFADYSDPDVCRVGEDYYMTASSFNCVPGLPILHSKDIVNWQLIGHAIDRLLPDDLFSNPQHGNGVWAPSIRHYNGEFYIYYGDPDYGIYMLKTNDPAGKWSEPILVKKGKGLIDPAPLWDENGKNYLVYAYAGSRAGIKSVLSIAEMSEDGAKVITPGKIIYDGHENDPTIEGPKLYKKNGYYYIFAPAGGVSTGWQTVLRSNNIYGPYERKIVLVQGKTNINGPHQGAWVETPNGEHWFYHFQDTGPFGRVVHLQPMIWKNDWPIIGINSDNGEYGEPVIFYRKPNVGKSYPKVTPAESDFFNSGVIGLQWQWHANPMDWWYFADNSSQKLNLYSVPVPKNYRNLWDIPNLLLQKFPSNNFTATAKLDFLASTAINGERAGLVIMGIDYALLSIQKTEDGLILSQNECLSADKGSVEVVNNKLRVNTVSFYFRVKVTPDAKCVFSYSKDGKEFYELGKPFQAKEGKWIGAKIGFFCSRPINNNDGGCLVLDWFTIE